MINCGLIGYGYWGPNIAKSLSRVKGVNLAVICDKALGKQKEAKLLYPNSKISSDVESLFNNADLDAIIIASPAFTHYELAAQGLKAGKHLLIEKPLTLTAKEAEDLVKINNKAKKVAMVGHTFEYNPAVTKIKKIIKEDSFGRIYYVYSTRVNLGQIRGDVNALWNLAPHDISILNFLLDETPEEVMATGASFLQKKIEDVVFVILRYPNNVLAEVHLSWLDPAKERKVTIVGSKKMLVFDDLDNEMPIKIYDKRVDTGEVAKGLSTEYKIKLHSGDIYVPQVDNKEPLLEELNHFFSCIRYNRKPLTDLENGLRVVKVLESCQNSIQNNGKWVKIQ